jgi:amino acid adenylation domain-containing protein
VADATTLHEYLERSARHVPRRTAVEDAAGAAVTYAELDALAGRVRDRLRRLGVAPGDRVGIYLRKSIDAIAAIYGILKAGAAYVPVDPLAPPARNAYILDDCSVSAAVVGAEFEAALREEIGRLGAVPPLLLVRAEEGAVPLRAALDREDARDSAPAVETARPTAEALAYILYTSGSTGRPKGVMLSHRNATSYIDWCSAVFAPTSEDRLSNHAPLHFDLSILDLFLAAKHGAALVPVGEAVGKDPSRLAELIAEKRLTIWYSAPSILTLLAQYGDLARHDASALRIVLFAGEVFPVKHLRALKALWPAPRYFNLYGPTETNVCTYFEVPREIPPERTAPYPIGSACSHFRVKVVDGDGAPVAPGGEGELCAAGDGVMQGYWNLPVENARAFLADPSGERWYRTGDIVVEDAAGNFVYVGRRDRMVKRRGYRVELGEIEAGLYRHPDIEEAAVIALPDAEAGVRIKAVLACRGGRRPSLIALKRFCAEALPLYMVPDLFAFVDALPKTSTGKTDYQKLTAEGQPGR